MLFAWYQLLTLLNNEKLEILNAFASWSFYMQFTRDQGFLSLSHLVFNFSGVTPTLLEGNSQLFWVKKENFGVYFSAFNKFLGPFLTQNELLGCIFVKNQVTCCHDCVCTNMFWKKKIENWVSFSAQNQRKRPKICSKDTKQLSFLIFLLEKTERKVKKYIFGCVFFCQELNFWVPNRVRNGTSPSVDQSSYPSSWKPYLSKKRSETKRWRILCIISPNE